MRLCISSGTLTIMDNHYQQLNQNKAFQHQLERHLIEYLLSKKGVMTLSSYSLYLYASARGSHNRNWDHNNQFMFGYSLFDIIRRRVPISDQNVHRLQRQFLAMVNKSFGTYMERYLLDWLHTHMNLSMLDDYSHLKSSSALNVKSQQTKNLLETGTLGLIPDGILDGSCVNRIQHQRTGWAHMHYAEPFTPTPTLIEIKVSLVGRTFNVKWNGMNRQHYFQMQLYMRQHHLHQGIYIQYSACHGMIWRLVEYDGGFVDECLYYIQQNVNQVHDALHDLYQCVFNDHDHTKYHEQPKARLEYVPKHVFENSIRHHQSIFMVALLNVPSHTSTQPNGLRIYYPMGEHHAHRIIPSFAQHMTQEKLFHTLCNIQHIQW